MVLVKVRQDPPSISSSYKILNINPTAVIIVTIHGRKQKGLLLIIGIPRTFSGAEGGTRTRTGVSPLDPEYKSIVTPGNMK
jgi:hypothetical protein